MTVAPLSRSQADRFRVQPPDGRRAPEPSRRVVGRRRSVLWAKRVLPLMAVLLLSTMVLWPQISNWLENARIAYRKSGLSGHFQAGHLYDMRYRGVDSHDRPYTITASQAEQVGADRLNLTQPKGDVTSENGTWTYGEAQNGVFRQRIGQLDLWDNVILYRDNGVTMHTSAASLDFKQGAAAGSEPTHTEGPFGQLDSHGFALVDKGAIIQFDGKSKLILNGSHQ